MDKFKEFLAGWVFTIGMIMVLIGVCFGLALLATGVLWLFHYYPLATICLGVVALAGGVSAAAVYGD